MNDALKERLLEMLDDIASESRHYAKSYVLSAIESREETDRIIIEVVKFIDKHFVENCDFMELWPETGHCVYCKKKVVRAEPWVAK